VHPGEECVELEFSEPYSMPSGAEVALEDYGRVLTRARAASTWSRGTPGRVHGLHLCSPGLPPASVREDLEAFARDLVQAAASGTGSA
jgi:hypothetical protein